MDLATNETDIAPHANVVRNVSVGDLDEVSLSAGSIGERTILHQSVEIAMQRKWTHYYHSSRARLRGMRRMPAFANGVWPETLYFARAGSAKRQTRQPSQQMVYRNVCTEQDPPYSVAISPIRRCVAFGCKGGIELYWIDPQTSQNLNRWFPLIKPSDHVYFLQPRRYIDSEARLRLISSSNYEPAKNEQEDESRPEDAGAGSRATSWLTLAESWQLNVPRGARRQAHVLDHSQAVPLSDGHHILFLDNATGLLCLGSDRPVGSPYRLSRKFVFLPPPRTQVNGSTPAAVYAATRDLSHGVRIVAAYGEHIVLYSVPPDVMKFSTAEQENAIQPADVPFHELETLQALRHPLSNAPAVREYYGADARFEELNMGWVSYLASAQAMSLEDIWPLQVEGCVIGTLHDIAALAVQETVEEGPAVWAFSKAGVAKAWRLDDGERPVLRLRSCMDRDGNTGNTSVEIVER